MRTMTLGQSKHFVTQTKLDSGQSQLVVCLKPTKDGEFLEQHRVELSGIEEIKQLRDFLNECIEEDEAEHERYELFPNCFLNFH